MRGFRDRKRPTNAEFARAAAELVKKLGKETAQPIIDEARTRRIGASCIPGPHKPSRSRGNRHRAIRRWKRGNCYGVKP